MNGRMSSTTYWNLSEGFKLRQQNYRATPDASLIHKHIQCNIEREKHLPSLQEVPLRWFRHTIPKK